MDYEKLYKEAIERVKNNPNLVPEEIFPELQDSMEDEKIRKAMIKYFTNGREYLSLTPYGREDYITWLEKQGKEEYSLKSFKDEDVRKFMQYIEKQAKAYEFNLPNRSYDIYAFAKDLLVWLEKQCDKKPILDVEIPFGAKDSELEEVSYSIPKGYHAEIEDNKVVIKKGEQKSVDKVEPKFEIGDWVMLDRPVLITKVEDMPYNTHQYWTSDGTWFGDATKAKLWTIQDAKDGDVLVTDSWLYMFKYTNNKALIQFHCKCPINGKTYEWSFLSDDSYLDIYIDANIHPATKEQRDLLFRKMKEAGYEWDAEKKELKKIEQKPVITSKFKQGDWIVHNNNTACENSILQIRKVELNDYYCVEKCGARVYSHEWINENYHFLDIDDVKQLFEQKPTEWSDEDEEMIDSIIGNIKYLYSIGSCDNATVDMKVNWLKSLRPQKQWKPDSSMLICLEYAIKHINKDGDKRILSKLLEQLKKLREE